MIDVKRIRQLASRKPPLARLEEFTPIAEARAEAYAAILEDLSANLPADVASLDHVAARPGKEGLYSIEGIAPDGRVIALGEMGLDVLKEFLRHVRQIANELDSHRNIKRMRLRTRGHLGRSRRRHGTRLRKADLALSEFAHLVARMRFPEQSARSDGTCIKARRC